jgi:Ca-activated chloride channel homolog
MKIIYSIVFTLLFAFSVSAQRQAEVIVTYTYLRKLPEIGAEKVQTVQKGEKITFEKNGQTNGWYYVSVQNRAVKGWIRRDTVGQMQAEQKIAQTSKTGISAPRPVANSKQNTNTPPPKKIEPAVSLTPTIITIPAAQPSPSPAVEAPAEETEVLRIETEEVSLNVRVVDANNRTVNNLNRSDFKIYEDDVLQPVTSLTTTEVPVINALVIDNSRSLRTQLKKVIEAGKIIVETNRPKDETTVVRFVSSDKIEVMQDFTTSKNSLNNALDNLLVEGGQTAIIDAVYQTAKRVEQYQNSQKKEDVKLRALILVSDGDDRSSSYTEQQLFELLRESNVQIYAIGFVNNLSNEAGADKINRQDKAKAFLTRLAGETGGKVYFPNSIDELAQIAADISRELRTQYLISYTPTNQNRDGSFRKIKVSVAEGANKEKRTAITRTGRNSPPK